MSDSLRVLTEALRAIDRVRTEMGQRLPESCPAGLKIPVSVDDIFHWGTELSAIRAALVSRSPEPSPNLSSQMIDGLTFKLKRGEPWTESERGELLDAYQSLMEAYHETAPFRSPEPPAEKAVRCVEQIAAVMREEPRLPDDMMLSEIQDYLSIADYDVPVRSYNPAWELKDGKWVLPAVSRGPSTFSAEPSGDESDIERAIRETAEQGGTVHLDAVLLHELIQALRRAPAVSRGPAPEQLLEAAQFAMGAIWETRRQMEADKRPVTRLDP